MSRDESLSTSSSPSDLPETNPRYAVWRRRREDPRTPKGWILWGDRHLTLPQRRSIRHLLLGALVLICFAGLLGGPGAVVLGLIVTWLIVVLYARPGAREHANLPDLSGEKAFPVTLDVWHNRRRVGRENGWVAFVDGWLVYEGLRTSFSVRSSDVESKLSPSGLVNLWFPALGTASLSLLTDYMQTNRPAKLGSHAALNEAYNKWKGAAIPIGRPIYPPVQYSPRVLGERVAEFAGGGMLLTLLGFLFFLPGFYAGAAITAVGAIACFVAARRMLRRLRGILNPSNLGTDEKEGMGRDLSAKPPLRREISG